jgi:hypothetical protein
MIEFKAIINYQHRHFGKDQDWETYDRQERIFSNLTLVKEWIKETYKNKRSQPMYVDTKDGAKKVGWIFSSRELDGYEKHWIDIVKVTTERIYR